MLTLMIFVFALLFTSAFGAFLPIEHRTTSPYFPKTPASCPICEREYPNINSCADAAPVLANFTNVIWNPGAFVDVIKCACTDTFQSAFAQCVDCFVQTNQTDVLDTPDLPSLVEGIRSVCAVASTLIGNVSGSQSAADAAAASTSATAASTTPAPATESENGVQRVADASIVVVATLVAATIGLLV